MLTYEPPSFPKAFSWAMAHPPSAHIDIEVGVVVNILDPVDARLQFLVFEDGRGGHGHRQSEYGNAGNTSRSRRCTLPYTLATWHGARYSFCLTPSKSG